MKAKEVCKMDNPLDKKRIEIISELAGSGKNILNIGSRNDNYLTHKLENNNQVVTIDLVKNTDVIADLNHGFPIKPKTFECVVAGEIIEHLYDTDFIFNEMNRVLKNDGFLILSVPNICSLRNRVKVLFGGLPIYGAKDVHIRDFNLPFLNELLRKSGFKMIEKKTNGVWFRGMNVIPSKICPASFGEHLIIKAKKV